MSRRRRRARSWTGALALAAALSALVAAALPFLLTPSAEGVARENPRTTALVEQRRAEARAQGRAFQPRLSFVSLDRISPRLAEAVVLSEDASFWVHHGFDWGEMRNAAAEGLERGRMRRGASTITQQLARNLALGTERSLWRKVREAALAWKMERALPKKRILALYLNVAEWSDGVFGAEPAARHWFGVAARDLSTAQAVVLASMLPAPRRATLPGPPRWLADRSRRLLDLMQATGRIGEEEHARASAELERILAGPGGDEALEPPVEETAAPAPRGTPAPTSAEAPPAEDAPSPQPSPPQGGGEGELPGSGGEGEPKPTAAAAPAPDRSPDTER